MMKFWVVINMDSGSALFSDPRESVAVEWAKRAASSGGTYVVMEAVAAFSGEGITELSIDGGGDEKHHS